MKSLPSGDMHARSLLLILLVMVLLLGLPIAVWLDLNNLAESEPASPVERPELGDQQRAQLLRRQCRRPRAGFAGLRPRSRITTKAFPAQYRFPPHCRSSWDACSASSKTISAIDSCPIIRSRVGRRTPSTALKRIPLAALRSNPREQPVDVSWSAFTGRVRLISPVLMGGACVNCHNAHPESPKRDWKVGDVRGIQEVTITQPLASNIFSFKYLLAYFALMAGSGMTFIGIATAASSNDPRHEQGTRNRE